MDDALIRPAPIAEVRWLMADAILGAPVRVAPKLGSVLLRDRQRVLAGRAHAMLERHGGALLADPVGLGKTYTSLAVASAYARAVVVAPAALREMWRSACAKTGVVARIVTHESLSRGMPEHLEIGRDTLIIVDEAHRFRNPATKRYSRLVTLSRGALTLLISATPIQNSLEDLAAPLALFGGAQTFSQSVTDLAHLVLREPVDNEATDLPALIGPLRIPVAIDASVLRLILDLPAPLPAADEGVAAALIAQLLVRRWTSSQAALVDSLRRALAKTLALRDAALAGKAITRADLGLWVRTEDSVQLAFAVLLGGASAVQDPHRTVETLDNHAGAIRRLLAAVAGLPDADAARAEALLALRARHPGERIVAFSQYARTVDALFSRLSASGRVAALTARGARIASGRTTRAEVIDQFTPTGHSDGCDVARVDLLLATDFLSEGLNLQRASVAVHMDLPWNPARMDQRIGRIRRLGSAHRTVSVYILDPTGAREATRLVEDRLATKLRLARDSVGVSCRILPSDTQIAGEPVRPAAAALVANTQRILERWRDAYAGARDYETGPGCAAPYAVTRSQKRGWLCVYGWERTVELVADLAGVVSQNAGHIQTALAVADGAAAPADARFVSHAFESARRWIASREAARVIDSHAAATSRTRRELLARIASTVAGAPRHRRAAVAQAAALARAAATIPLGLGAEEALNRLVTADLADAPWLDSIAAFASANAQRVFQPAPSDAQPRIIALIVFRGPTETPIVGQLTPE